MSVPMGCPFGETRSTKRGSTDAIHGCMAFWGSVVPGASLS